MSEYVIPVQDKLRSWAQNEEMIDQYYTEHGEDCNDAAELIEYYEDQNVLLIKETERLRKYCKEFVEENQRLRKVVDAALARCRQKLNNPVRHFETDGDSFYYRGATDMAAEILRALDGELSADKLEAWAHQEPGQYTTEALQEDFSKRDANFKEPCPTCYGEGWIGEMPGRMSSVRVVECPDCNGKGEKK